MLRPLAKTDWAGKRVTVMGLGRFGGGAGAVRFCCERKARVTVTDLAGEDELASTLAELADCRLEAIHLGGHQDRDFTSADLIVVNPAVANDNNYLRLAKNAGVPRTSEISLFWQLNRGTTIGVTGSNGKSTTAALIHAMLRADGRKCRLGGNVGISLLPEVDDIGHDEWTVLELSSFQFESLDLIEASPHVAVVTNFSPNHLDRHGTLDAYQTAKQTILRWQHERDMAVLNADDACVSSWPTVGKVFWYGGAPDRGDVSSHELPLANWLHLPGAHNLQNAAAAATTALAVGATPEAVRMGLQNFGGLPHRLQLVAEAAGRRFFNDSLATTPESAIAAIHAFDAPVILLAGGSDKQIDLSPLAEAMPGRVKSLAAMGQTADGLCRLVRQHGEGSAIPAMRVCTSLADAFQWAVDQSAAGDVVLLSPGCASYDWFRNFEERGNRFTELATAWCRQNISSIASA